MILAHKNIPDFIVMEDRIWSIKLVIGNNWFLGFLVPESCAHTDHRVCGEPSRSGLQEGVDELPVQVIGTAEISTSLDGTGLTKAKPSKHGFCYIHRCPKSEVEYWYIHFI